MDTVPANSATEDKLYSVKLIASDPDEGDQVNFLGQDLPSWLSLSSKGLLEGTPRNGNVGNNTVKIILNDLYGGSSEFEWIISVENTNDPPHFLSNPGSNPSTLEDNVYNYKAWSTDQDQNIVLF